MKVRQIVGIISLVIGFFGLLFFAMAPKIFFRPEHQSFSLFLLSGLFTMFLPGWFFVSFAVKIAMITKKFYWLLNTVSLIFWIGSFMVPPLFFRGIISEMRIKLNMLGSISILIFLLGWVTVDFFDLMFLCNEDRKTSQLTEERPLIEHEKLAPCDRDFGMLEERK